MNSASLKSIAVHKVQRRKKSSAYKNLAKQVLNDRAISCRGGIASFNQELNNDVQRNQAWLNVGNCYMGADMKLASIATVQQCNNGHVIGTLDDIYDANKIIDPVNYPNGYVECAYCGYKINKLYANDHQKLTCEHFLEVTYLFFLGVITPAKNIKLSKTN